MCRVLKLKEAWYMEIRGAQIITPTSCDKAAHLPNWAPWGRNQPKIFFDDFINKFFDWFRPHAPWSPVIEKIVCTSDLMDLVIASVSIDVFCWAGSVPWEVLFTLTGRLIGMLGLGSRGGLGTWRFFPVDTSGAVWFAVYCWMVSVGEVVRSLGFRSRDGACLSRFRSLDTSAAGLISVPEVWLMRSCLLGLHGLGPCGDFLWPADTCFLGDFWPAVQCESIRDLTWA